MPSKKPTRADGVHSLLSCFFFKSRKNNNIRIPGVIVPFGSGGPGDDPPPPPRLFSLLYSRNDFLMSFSHFRYSLLTHGETINRREFLSLSLSLHTAKPCPLPKVFIFSSSILAA
jgi:hypothetical protein